MSASLVGSEMCIRDRQAGRVGQAAWARRAGRAHRAGQEGGAGMGGGVGVCLLYTSDAADDM
eukprot:492336-Alexandrium_andersonii.AAC.1